ncbi:MAG TPA: hypothetical protein VGR22_05015 [Thermomicrobiales bacterium]|nr:hypothetical protein [Thermomicrobiales bacterium]
MCTAFAQLEGRTLQYLLIAHGMGCPSRFVVRILFPEIQETKRRMANKSATPALNSEEIAVLRDALRATSRPMTTAELVSALRQAAANR